MLLFKQLLGVTEDQLGKILTGLRTKESEKYFQVLLNFAILAKPIP
jgi:hypothetical protein